MTRALCYPSLCALTDFCAAGCQKLSQINLNLSGILEDLCCCLLICEVSLCVHLIFWCAWHFGCLSVFVW